ncbi:AMP-binding protein, partial [Pseudomonas sp. PA-3-11C]
MTNGIASEHAALESMVIVPKKERDEIVYALASGGNMPRQQDSIVEQFLQNARRRPGAWALRGRHMQTYAELAMAAQHLAERLVEHGVSKGSIVPFIANDDINPAAVALGILMADAAFLPIDPAWPSSVREAALDDVGASILIEQDGASVALRPRGQEVGRKKSETLTGEAAVYVIFTSGSTARPKAVAIAQRGLLNRFAWMTSFFGDEMPNTLQTTPLAFDSAV